MKISKRKDYFSWDEAFMQICRVIAQRSKDPSTQNGACIVNQDNIIIGLGYNGFPRGCADEKLPWDREGDFCDKKYAYVVHAEANAVLNTADGTKGAKTYCTLYPCNECAKILIQKGIREIIYENDKYHDDPIWAAARRLFKLAGVKTRQYVPQNEIIFKPIRKQNK
ncbi:MAG: dCMP deaminase [Parcubacteria group bacterium GW2011_GWC2_42_6]|nr:MAG: dCMP deaminase [Parcubacteria group bacterium GW2011_GWC2_42_6]KKT76391.1 MAG: dCMP deaminase [Parcubacteria group bacterium GW2011_GWF2_44_7]